MQPPGVMAFPVRIVVKIVLDVFSLFLVFLPWVVIHFAAKPFQRGFFCNDESLRHPFKPSTITTLTAALVGIILPVGSILIIEGIHYYQEKKIGRTELYYRFGDKKIPQYLVTCYRHIGIFLLGLAFQQTVNRIGKVAIGRLRPHFFDVCKPRWDLVNCTDARGLSRYVEIEDSLVCQSPAGYDLINMRMSFPSGHSSQSTYCGVYLALYLQARFTWKTSKLLRPLLQIICLYLALGCSLSRISDYKHHWSDVLAGALLGAATAVVVSLFVSGLFPRAKRMRKMFNDMMELKHKYDSLSSEGASSPMSQNSQLQLGHGAARA